MPSNASSSTPRRASKKATSTGFFTASGKRPFAHRIIVSTTNLWSEHAKDALQDQRPPVSKIDLNDLENSQIDWSQYQPNTRVTLKPKKVLRPHQIRALEKVEKGLVEADRGKLIMACGTGKTFTSLKHECLHSPSERYPKYLSISGEYGFWWVIAHGVGGRRLKRVRNCPG
ncbi:DEAD/DEAH box helicase family protein [Rhodospirillum sp. A1_3_36]|uniref:restriction endonuclease n=1 Tax=Rhodospirillum sp. A1_3_36 TaxID=3391666 RepID=UPI0039A785C2